MTADPDLPNASQRSSLAPPSVAGDLEAIFTNAADDGTLGGSSKVRAVTGRRSRVPLTTLGAVAAAGLVGLTGGAAMVGAHHNAQPATPPAPSKAAAVVPVEVASTPPVTLTIKPAGPIPVLDNAPVIEKAVHRPSRASRRHAGPSDLMAADRRLRVAYSHAVRAGVPRHILVSYRNRWADLREDASWRPSRVAAGYGEMSADLERMAKRPGVRPSAGRFSLFDFFS